MTPFEFVFFLYALMLSLALTHLVSGWAMALRHARSIRWSAPHVMWAVSALLQTTGNLASFWSMRDAPAWNSWLVLSNFAFAIINYVWCVFITPEVGDDGVLDLEAFHRDKRRQYLAPFALLTVFSIGSNVVNGMFAGYENWLSDEVLSCVALAITALAILSKRQSVQIAAGWAILVVGIYFVISASSIVGS